MPEFQAPPSGSYEYPWAYAGLDGPPVGGNCSVEISVGPNPPDPAVNGGRKVRVYIAGTIPIKYIYDQMLGVGVKSFKIAGVPCGSVLVISVIDYIRLPDGHSSGLRYYTLTTTIRRKVDCTLVPGSTFKLAPIVGDATVPKADYPHERRTTTTSYEGVNGDLTDASGTVLLAHSAQQNGGPINGDTLNGGWGNDTTHGGAR